MSGLCYHRAALDEGEPLAADYLAIGVTYRIRRDKQVIDPAPDSLSCVCGDDADHVVSFFLELRQILRLTEFHGDELHSVDLTDMLCSLLRPGNALAFEGLHDSSVLGTDIDGVRGEVNNVRHGELLSGALPQSGKRSQFRPHSNFRKVG